MKKIKGRLLWYIIFALIFLLYHDFWNWGKIKPLIGGWLPAWFFYLMALIVAYSLAAFLFTKKYWPKPPSDLTRPSAKKR